MRMAQGGSTSGEGGPLCAPHRLRYRTTWYRPCIAHARTHSACRFDGCGGCVRPSQVNLTELDVDEDEGGDALWSDDDF